MVPRRALIVAPLYDGEWLSPLAGRPDVVKRLTTCLEEQGGYEVKALSSIVQPPELLQTIEDLFSSDGELLFYFYGHGCVRKNGNGYFATSSARNFEEGIPMSEVITSAITSQAREIVLILDCCHAGAATEVTNVTIAGLAEQAIQQTGRVLLAGCASHQNGWEIKADDEQKKIGAFSYHILKGLEGEASYGRGKVRGSMLGTYVTEVFKAWNQDPISRSNEAGSRECIITSGFPSKTIPVTSSEGIAKQAKLIGLPFKPSQMFVGRSAELDSLLTLLTVGDRQVAVSATVEGLGGIGKTEIILQLIYQPDVLATYKTIVWLDGAGPLPPQWEKIASDLGVRNPGDEPAVLIQTVERELHRRGNPLIILDNANEWRPIESLIPNGISLLVTTRMKDFGGNGFQHVELGVLSNESATNFLIQMVPALESDPLLPQLVNSLEGHALALELAGKNIDHLGISAEKYIQRLNEHQKDNESVLDRIKYGKTVDACLSLTWDGLKQDSSRILWRRASLFAPTSAHRDLLQVSFTGDHRTRHQIERMMRYDYENIILSKLLSNPEEFDDAYAELRSFHILARVEGTNNERWAMHRLVREYGRERLQKGEVTFHAMSISEWLTDPTLPLEPEIPHLVATILDSARYGSEFSGLSDRSIERELWTRTISSPEIELQFDLSQFVFYIREQLQDPKALTMILEGLSDVNEDVRIQSINLLENIGSIPEVLDGLASSLNDPDSRVRDIAGRTLAEHGSDKTVSILSAAVENSKQRSSLAAVKALGLMGQKAHNALRKALKCENQSTQIEAALLLCEQGEREGSQILINIIYSVSKREKRRFIDALGTAKDPKAVEIIVEFLSDKEHSIQAIVALGEIGDRSVYPKLLELLEDDDDNIRCNALESIEKLNIADSSTAIVNIISKRLDNSLPVTGRFVELALNMLARNNITPPSAILNTLLLTSNNRDVRKKCAAILAQQQNIEVLPVLIEALKDDYFEVRIIVVKALGLIRHSSAKAPLTETATNDVNPSVRDAASKALKQIRRK
jgi:HEAT repeat protein